MGGDLHPVAIDRTAAPAGGPGDAFRGPQAPAAGLAVGHGAGGDLGAALGVSEPAALGAGLLNGVPMRSAFMRPSPRRRRGPWRPGGRGR